MASQVVFVVGRIGEQLAQDPDRWEDDCLLSVAGDVCGPERVEVLLKNPALSAANRGTRQNDHGPIAAALRPCQRLAVPEGSAIRVQSIPGLCCLETLR